MPNLESQTLEDVLGAARQSSTASLHEAAARRFALPPSIRPLDPASFLIGRALPVSSAPQSNLALHHAILHAVSGDVIVADVGSASGFGYWGEVMTVAAQARGIAGIVFNGCIRDAQRLIELGFPTFCAGIAIHGTNKEPAGNRIGTPITLDGVVVRKGDLVVGDRDGVVVLPWEDAPGILQKAFQRDQDEGRYLERLKAGENTVEIYALPPLEDGASPISQRRRSISPPGLTHGQLPIPAASRVANLIATGGVRGVDPATGRMPEDLADEVRLMFANLRTIIEAGGGRLEDIVKVTVWVGQPETRAALNSSWEEMFPYEEARPARHVLHQDLPAGMRVQCQALAMVEGP